MKYLSNTQYKYSMRYNDLIEAVENYAIISKANQLVERAILQFIKETIHRWEFGITASRRDELGYHRYDNNAKGYKPFDQEEFDKKNTNWSTSDQIYNGLDELMPDVESGKPHIVYALMSTISKELTKIIQEHVKKLYGDPVYLRSGQIERNVKDIRVSVWWKTREETDTYQGVYRAESNRGSELETLLEIVVDRVKWAQALRSDIIGVMTGDSIELDEFTHGIINTFIHEYAHLEQDIKGSTGNLGLIPNKKTRHAYVDHRDDFIRYISRTAEIDAHASGAAAEVINAIIRKYAKYDARWNRDSWSADNISTTDWNESIRDAISGTAYGYLPKGEYAKYLAGLDRQHYAIDPTIKDKYLKKVKQRFLRTYVSLLQKYIRADGSKKLATPPTGSLPEG